MSLASLGRSFLQDVGLDNAANAFMTRLAGAGAAGYIAGFVADMASGHGSMRLETLGLAALGAVAIQVHKAYRAGVDALLSEDPRTMTIAAYLRDRVEDGATSVKRGTVWFVYDNHEAAPRTMSDREYSSYRSTQPLLTEFVVGGGLLRSRTMQHGLADSTATGRPATIDYDIASGEILKRKWMLGGDECDYDEAQQAHNLHTRETAPSVEAPSFRP